ncbi:MAG: multicopper oxidase domain-containing protein [Solirubrobacteraceae bacterium]
MRARAVTLPALAAAALALAACGESRGTARTSPAPVEDATVPLDEAVAVTEVSLVDYRLEPANPRLARSGTIAFAATNDGQTRHALRVNGPTGEVSSTTLRPGERTTIAVRLPPGTYKWYCPIADHEQRGMVGRVRVAE